jgi:omega-6 fatty acid desaturase (delta-12 desaturase)
MKGDKSIILATRKYAKEDKHKSKRLFFSTLVLLLAAFAGAIVNVHIVPQLICAVLASLLVARFFIFYHDYLHNAILKRSTLAKVVFIIFWWYMLAPVSIWKRSHDFHHTHNSKLYTSSIGSYPIVTKESFLAATPKERFVYLFIRHPLTIAFGYIFVFLLGMCIRSLISNPRRHIDSLISLIFHVGLGVTIYSIFGLQSLLIGYILPSFLAMGLGAYLFYAQHNFPTAVHHKKEDWDYVSAALLSSSYMKMPKWMHWFTGNIGYHHIHHINPGIPFYNLPRAHEDLEALQQAGTTSLSPKDIAACFRLKVWDEERGRMIGLKEMYGKKVSA